jgi:hypothetical protein
MLNKDHAEAIARKLKAVMIAGRRHDLAVVKHNGQTIAQFGIRRGSRRDQGHDYIPGQIHVTRRQALLLAQCPMSLEEWIDIMRQKGHIVI